jgi:hypothetical protein
MAQRIKSLTIRIFKNKKSTSKFDPDAKRFKQIVMFAFFK